MATKTDQHEEAIEQAAKEYVAVRDSRMELTKKEVEKKEALVALMKENELTEYESDEIEVRLLAGKEKLKVTAATDGDTDEDEDTDE